MNKFSHVYLFFVFALGLSHSAFGKVVSFDELLLRQFEGGFSGSTIKPAVRKSGAQVAYEKVRQQLMDSTVALDAGQILLFDGAGLSNVFTSVKFGEYPLLGLNFFRNRVSGDVSLSVELYAKADEISSLEDRVASALRMWEESIRTRAEKAFSESRKGYLEAINSGNYHPESQYALALDQRSKVDGEALATINAWTKSNFQFDSLSVKTNSKYVAKKVFAGKWPAISREQTRELFAALAAAVTTVSNDDCEKKLIGRLNELNRN